MPSTVTFALHSQASILTSDCITARCVSAACVSLSEATRMSAAVHNFHEMRIITDSAMHSVRSGQGVQKDAGVVPPVTRLQDRRMQKFRYALRGKSAGGSEQGILGWWRLGGDTDETPQREASDG